MQQERGGATVPLQPAITSVDTRETDREKPCHYALYKCILARMLTGMAALSSSGEITAFQAVQVSFGPSK
jgi:hypothetical protein